MKYHKICEKCVINGDCLFQTDDDVESCWDVQNAIKEEKENG